MNRSTELMLVGLLALVQVLAGPLLAAALAPLVPHAQIRSVEADWLGRLSHMDAMNYLRLVNEGYGYNDLGRSNVAFFPVYPLLAWGLLPLVGSPEVTLLLISQACGVALFFVAHAWFREVVPSRALAATGWLAAWPGGLFLGIAYSENVFMLLTALLLLGMRRNWPLLVLVLLCGVATGTRPVGVALVPALVLHVWNRRESVVGCLVDLLWVLPWSMAGLLAYMAFQAGAFDDPLAFAKVQQHWRLIPMEYEYSHWQSLLLAEPIWNVYVPGSARWWAGQEGRWWQCWALMNPPLWLAALVAVAWGWRRGWLSWPEAVAGLGLLAIPYLTRAYEMSFASFGRFSSVVLPMYAVWPRLLADRRIVEAAVLLLLAGIRFWFLLLYCAGFAVF